MDRRQFLWGVPLLVIAGASAHAQARIQGTLYKIPTCSCCNLYVEYLTPFGFEITVFDDVDLAAVKLQAAVPAGLEGCHTLLMEGYVFEGLVPVEIIRRVLQERPQIAGISLPGMPVGVPGMPGERTTPLSIYSFGSQGTAIYATI